MSGVVYFFARRPWRRALLWLCFLGPFFFLTYGLANTHTASLTGVSSIVFAWEAHIPFWAWTIIPYWSIDFFYGLSLFLCNTRQELRTLALRLVLATLVCVSGFLLFPLRFSFERPDIAQPLFRWLFDTLGAFDLPYNQAPSLHICLLIILWDHFARHAPPAWRPVVHAWAALIGVSVLTTYQHHAIDVFTAIPAGVLCCYLVPAGGWRPWRSSLPAKAKKLAAKYATGAAVFTAAAVISGGWGWLLLWPALSLALVMTGYLALGPAVFQKIRGMGADAGSRTWYSRVLLAPYEFGARLSRRWYLAKVPSATEVAPGLWVSGYPAALPVPDCGVLDLSAEYVRAPATHGRPYAAMPMMDLLPPTAAELHAAAEALRSLQEQGPVLVHCALGLTRSVVVAACALLRQGQCVDLQTALAHIARQRSGIEVSPAVAATVQALLQNTLSVQQETAYE